MVRCRRGAADRPPAGFRAALLVGRERELAVLREHLTAALAGQGQPRADRRRGGHRQDGARGGDLPRGDRAGGARPRRALLRPHRDARPTARGSTSSPTTAHATTCHRLPPAFAERGTVGAVASQAALFHAVLDFLAAVAAAAPPRRPARGSSTGRMPPASTCCASSPARLPRCRCSLLVTYRARRTDPPPSALPAAAPPRARVSRHPPRPAPPRRGRRARSGRGAATPLPDADTDRLVA